MYFSGYNAIYVTQIGCSSYNINYSKAIQFTLHIAFHVGIGVCPKCRSQTSPAVEAPLLAGIIPTVVLLLANVVTGVVVFLITRHCYKKTSQKSSPSKGEDVYEQVEGPKTYEDIVMTDSPAYGPVK